MLHCSDTFLSFPKFKPSHDLFSYLDLNPRSSQGHIYKYLPKQLFLIFVHKNDENILQYNIDHLLSLGLSFTIHHNAKKWIPSINCFNNIYREYEEKSQCCCIFTTVKQVTPRSRDKGHEVKVISCYHVMRGQRFPRSAAAALPRSSAASSVRDFPEIAKKYL